MNKEKPMSQSAAPDFQALIPVVNQTWNGEEVQTVNARHLHVWLGVGRDFSTWIKARIDHYGFQIGRDYICLRENPYDALPETGDATQADRSRIDYHVILDMAKELAMVENNDRGRQARRYFIECEKRIRGQQPQLPRSYKEAVQHLLQSLEREEELAGQLEAAQPALTFYEKVGQAVNTCTIHEAAKKIGVKPLWLYATLRDRGVLHRVGAMRNLPQQRYIDRGYFTTVTGHHEENGQQKQHTTARVTGKGVQWLYRMLCDSQSAPQRLLV